VVEVSEAHTEKGQRYAISQSTFREINERVNDVNQMVSDRALKSWVCECADTHCSERIEMTLIEYEALRSYPRRFAIVSDPSHYYPDVEKVVDRNDLYWVVEKFGHSAKVAADYDPRRTDSHAGTRGGG
jgi:hypothetical protein